MWILLIMLPCIINVLNQEKSTLVPIANEIDNIAHASSSNLILAANSRIFQDEGWSSRDPDPLAHEKWKDVIPVNSSDNLVIVLDLGEIESAKAKDLPNMNGLVNANIDPIFQKTSSPLISINNCFERFGKNISTVEDGVFYLEGIQPSVELSGNLQNDDLFLTDHYHCDAYTDTEVEINAKCYSREDHDLSFSKGRGPFLVVSLQELCGDLFLGVGTGFGLLVLAAVYALLLAFSAVSGSGLPSGAFVYFLVCCPVVDGSSQRNPSPLEQEMWQNALPVDSTGNLEVVLDLGDIESSKGIKNNISTVENGVHFMEGDMPPPEGTVGTLNDNKYLLTDRYHYDAYTDTEVDIFAKCYVIEDHDLSFSEGHGFCNFLGDDDQVNTYSSTSEVEPNTINMDDLAKEQEVNINPLSHIDSDPLNVNDQNFVPILNNESLFVESHLEDVLVNTTVQEDEILQKCCYYSGPLSEQSGKKVGTVVLNETNVEGGVIFEERDLPRSKGKFGMSYENSFPINDYYNSDVFTDIEDMDMLAKCFARDDNDASCTKSHRRRGRKPKAMV
ncbi:hypothetical protein MA16_Dca006221 [Dendrobium catenatum]|uniref:Uncharacterized protein n=1 Tax=Dendrobium catenatum TaxID=906689 RepID=A0A2I0X4U3_9ASPA|nr:hypothetical protein MA16_Dca006221 [Dendrobium catenatum]